MDLSFLSKGKLEILAQLIGRSDFEITADDWTRSNTNYGNVLIASEGVAIEIINDDYPFSFLGQNDEAPRYDVRLLQSKSDYEASVLQDSLRSESVDRELVGIKVVRDRIEIIKKQTAKTMQVVESDQAFIFDFEDSQWLLGMTSGVMPLNKMVFGEDVMKDVIPIDLVEEMWQVDEEGKAYMVEVTRNVIDL